jgi:hypothetical protein
MWHLRLYRSLVSPHEVAQPTAEDMRSFRSGPIFGIVELTTSELKIHVHIGPTCLVGWWIEDPQLLRTAFHITAIEWCQGSGRHPRPRLA